MEDRSAQDREFEESSSSRLMKQIKEVCELAGAKTEEYARISRKRLDVVSIGRDIHKEKAALGGRIYDLAEAGGELPDPLADPQVLEAIGRIRDLERSLQACEEEIGRIREAARERVADVRRKYKEGDEDR